MADAASSAFDKFARARGQPARLNFGDCMAYAVSAVMRAPLSFKGGGFGLTDVMPHPASIRM
jgi:ribonuclease VapC